MATTTAHLIEWLNSKALLEPDAGENSHPLLVGMQNGAATLEDTLALVKHSLNIWSIRHASQYLSKWIKSLCPHKTCTWMFLATYLSLPKIESNQDVLINPGNEMTGSWIYITKWKPMCYNLWFHLHDTLTKVKLTSVVRGLLEEEKKDELVVVVWDF